MYGKASLEVSNKLLEMRGNDEISKVESLFSDQQLSAHYSKFQEKAMQLMEQQKTSDDKNEEQRLMDDQKRHGTGAFKPKRKRMSSAQAREERAAQYQKEKEERKRVADEQLANAKISIDREPKPGAIVMGKQKKALDTSLDYNEKLRLKQ